MIIWEDNNNDNDVSNVRTTGDNLLRNSAGNRNGRTPRALILPSPLVLMAQVFATLAGFVAGFWLLMLALNVALDTPEDHAEPRSAAAFGWEVDR
jgi:hypothetical protein